MSPEERTNNSENENIYHPKFAWYAERSSLADINPKSYHLIDFELVNPLLIGRYCRKRGNTALRQSVQVFLKKSCSSE